MFNVLPSLRLLNTNHRKFRLGWRHSWSIDGNALYGKTLMKWFSVLALLAVLVGLLSASTLWAQTNEPSSAPIYRLDLSGLNKLDLNNLAVARKAWDILQVATCIQGIANRDGANVFICFLPQMDDFWWNYVPTNNDWIA